MLLDQTFIPLDEVPARLPRKRSGRPIHKSSIYRWCVRGVAGHKLKTFRIGGILHTSVEELERFICECSGLPPADNGRTSQRRKRQIAEAEGRLNRMGI